MRTLFLALAATLLVADVADAQVLAPRGRAFVAGRAVGARVGGPVIGPRVVAPRVGAAVAFSAGASTSFYGQSFSSFSVPIIQQRVIEQRIDVPLSIAVPLRIRVAPACDYGY